jgi:hypothetical protein
MNFFKQHWKGLLSGLCGVTSVAAAVIPGAAPVALVVGLGCAALTAGHVLEQKDVDEAKAAAEALGKGIAGVEAEIAKLEAKGKGKKP